MFNDNKYEPTSTFPRQIYNSDMKEEEGEFSFVMIYDRVANMPSFIKFI